MFQFNKKYFLLFVLLFIVELYIGFYVHDRIIRPYIGDLLVVILIYAFVKSFIDAPYFKVALFTLLFSFLVEFAQYLDVVTFLGLEHNNFAKVIIGTSFAWLDVWAYIGGFVVIIIAEWLLLAKSKHE